MAASNNSVLTEIRANDLDEHTTGVTSPSRRARARAWINSHPRLRVAWRILLGIVGVAVIAIGLVLVPLPGPGWLIVFAGLWILGLEFAAARRITRWLKHTLASVAARFRGWKSRRSATRNS